MEVLDVAVVWGEALAAAAASGVDVLLGRALQKLEGVLDVHLEVRVVIDCCGDRVEEAHEEVVADLPVLLTSLPR